MEQRSLLREIFAHRFSVALVIVVAAAMAFAGWVLTPVTYSAQATVLVVRPAEQTTEFSQPSLRERNPLLALDYDLSQLSAVLKTRLETDATARAVAQAGGYRQFSVGNTSTLPGSATQMTPTLELTVNGDDQEKALSGLDALIERTRTELDNLQDEAAVPADARSTLQIIAPASPEPEDASNKLKGAMLFGGITVLLGGVVIATVIGVRRTRNNSALPASVAAVAAGAGTASDDTDSEPVTSTTPAPEPDAVAVDTLSEESGAAEPTVVTPMPSEPVVETPDDSPASDIDSDGLAAESQTTLEATDELTVDAEDDHSEVTSPEDQTADTPETVEDTTGDAAPDSPTDSDDSDAPAEASPTSPEAVDEITAASVDDNDDSPEGSDHSEETTDADDEAPEDDHHPDHAAQQ